MRTGLFLVIIAIVITIFGCLSKIHSTPAEAKPLRYQLTINLASASVTVGNTALLTVDLSDRIIEAGSLQAVFDEKKIPVFPHPNKKAGTYVGLIPVSYRSAPGIREVRVGWTDKDGRHSRSLALAVKAGQFKRTVLKVAPGKVDISKKSLARIEKDKQEIAAAYAKGLRQPLWSESWLRPVPGIVTSPYGTCRIMNGKVKSYHNGVDFRAAVGTPIVAVNAGIVRLAKDLFFSGNAVIIDHGGGLFTIYAHLSRIDVVAGQRIKRGHVIGLTGKTGRVTGPHLHWGVKLNGIAVNPMDLMDITGSLFE